MSKAIESQVWRSALSAELKPITAILADMGNDDGKGIYPSVAYVAWLLGKSERSIQRQLRLLEEKGILILVAYEGGGRGLAREYRLSTVALPQRPKWVPKRVTPTSPFNNPENLEKGDIDGSKRVTPVSPDPLVDPLEEKKIPPTPLKSKKGYREPDTVLETLYYYPPDDFIVTDLMIGNLIELQIDFDRAEILKLTSQWLISRRADLQRKGRTRFNWENDWLRYIQTVWDKRREREPVKAKTKPNGLPDVKMTTLAEIEAMLRPSQE